MKKLKINNIIKVAFMLWVGLGIYSCDDNNDINFATLDPDTRLVGNEGIIIAHVNPKTGVDYTEEELALLDYDPGMEEFYLPMHDINLTVNVEAKPVKIEVESVDQPGVVLATFDTFTENNGIYSAVWSTNVTDLGINEGGNVRYAFFITYDDLGVDGRQYASTQKFIFRVHHSAEGAASAIAFLSERLGDKQVLEYTSTGLLPNIDGDVGAFLEFNGTNQFASISEDDVNLDFTHNEDFSVSFWVNTTSTESDPSMVGDKDWGGGGNKGFVFAFRGDDWKINVGDGSNRVDINGPVINDGNWHHIAGTFDRDGMLAIYQDGVKIDEEDMSAIGDMDSTFPINIAQDGTGSYGDWFNGKIAGVTLNKYVLSAGEIASLAGGNTGVHLRQGNDLTVVTVDNNGVTPAVESGMIVREFDAPSFSIITDTDNALDFRYDSDFSVAFWVNTTHNESDPSMLGDKDWGGGGNKGFVFAFTGDDWKVNVGDGEGNRADASGPVINDGEWHLLAATFDRDGNMTLYQDGVEVSVEDMSAIGDMNSAMPIHIAQDGTGSYGDDFPGKIGNVYFFDNVLSPEEIENLFNE